jgi:hypothetical protein
MQAFDLHIEGTEKGSKDKTSRLPGAEGQFFTVLLHCAY